MPPKPRFTREEMVEAALDLVRQKGAEALTARELADTLGCSARPIFTAFENMDDLKGEVRKAAESLIRSYSEESMQYTPPFKKMGMQIILFASREPNLFKMIFMSAPDTATSFSELFRQRMGGNNRFEEVLADIYSVTPKQARYIFEHMWIFTYGIGVLSAMKLCQFSEEELSNRLGIEFFSLLDYVRNEDFDRDYEIPEKVMA